MRFCAFIVFTSAVIKNIPLKYLHSVNKQKKMEKSENGIYFTTIFSLISESKFNLQGFYSSMITAICNRNTSFGFAVYLPCVLISL